MSFRIIGILISILCSWLIAMSADLGKLELGAVINFIYPLIFGFVFLGIYWLLAKFIKNDGLNIFLLILTILLNLGVGLYIRFVKF